MIIYKITNTVNGKIYIGQTVQKLVDRWSDHCRPCLGHHVNRSAVAAAIRKYGRENFTIEEIDTAKTLEELNIKEATYIKALGCLSPSGYNLELGGGSKQCHPETKEKIRQKLKGKPFKARWDKGNPTPRTEAQKAHLSAMNKGKPNVALFKRVGCSNGLEFDSVNAAAAHFGVTRQTIHCLIKEGRTGRMGHSFKFL